MRCSIQPKTTTCFVHLGRFGDIMIMLPAMKHIADVTGVKPVMMISAEFAGMLEGCSYVTAWPMEGFSWFGDVKLGKNIADYWFDHVVVPKWWDCHGMGPPAPRPDEPSVTLNICGRKVQVAPEEWDSYQFSQWKAAGFTKQQMMDWPLVFDRRNKAREDSLALYHMAVKRPIVLYNFSGVSNPMGFEPEVIKKLRELGDRIRLVDLRHVRAEKIQDLLGLYDRALCVISGDTSTLHLAAASSVPLIACVANGGAGSIPRGNCVLMLRYSEVSRRVGEIKTVIEKLL